MKLYFYPDKGEQKLIFEITSDCAPNIGDTLIIYSTGYIVVKKTFYYYVENDAFYASDAIILNEIIGEYKNKMKIII